MFGANESKQDKTITITIGFEKNKFSRLRKNKDPINRKSTREFKQEELQKLLDQEPFIDFPYVEEGDIVICVPSDLIREKLKALHNNMSHIVFKGDFFEFISLEDCKSVMYQKLSHFSECNFVYDHERKKHVLKVHAIPAIKTTLNSKSIPFRENQDELEIDATTIYQIIIMEANVINTNQVRGLTYSLFKDFDQFTKEVFADGYIVTFNDLELTCIPTEYICEEFELLHNGVFRITPNGEKDDFQLYANKAKFTSAVHRQLEKICGHSLTINPNPSLDLQHRFIITGNFSFEDVKKISAHRIRVFQASNETFAVSFVDAYKTMIEYPFEQAQKEDKQNLSEVKDAPSKVKQGEKEQAPNESVSNAKVRKKKKNKLVVKPKNKPGKRARMKKKSKLQAEMKQEVAKAIPSPKAEKEQKAEFSLKAQEAIPQKPMEVVDAKKELPKQPPQPPNETAQFMYDIKRMLPDSLMSEINKILGYKHREYSSEKGFIHLNLTQQEQETLRKNGVNPLPNVAPPGGVNLSQFAFQISKKEIRAKIKVRKLKEVKDELPRIFIAPVSHEEQKDIRPNLPPLILEGFGAESKQDAMATPKAEVAINTPNASLKSGARQTPKGAANANGNQFRMYQPKQANGCLEKAKSNGVPLLRS